MVAESWDRFEDIPQPIQFLVRLMQDHNFGRIKGLHVEFGMPRFDPKPVIVRELKCGGGKGPRSEKDLPDFSLTDQIVDLIDSMEKMGKGVIRFIEVRHGLPFRVAIVERAK